MARGNPRHTRIGTTGTVVGGTGAAALTDPGAGSARSGTPPRCIARRRAAAIRNNMSGLAASSGHVATPQAALGVMLPRSSSGTTRPSTTPCACAGFVSGNNRRNPSLPNRTARSDARIARVSISAVRDSARSHAS